MPRIAAQALWFLGICFLVIGFRDEKGGLFLLGALLAYVGSQALGDVSEADECRLTNTNPSA